MEFPVDSRKRFLSPRFVALGFARMLALPVVFLTLLLAPILHGLQMPGDGPETFTDLPSIRGTVKSVHGSDAIIQNQAGKTYTVHTSDNTHIYRNRQPLKMSEIRSGDVLIAAGALDEKANLMRAIFVADIDADTVQKLREELGKTWIAGKIVKIDETKITVDRIDHKTQVIEVDDTTSFRKGGQSVTLLDVHAGDPIRGKGVVKNGVFVPTQLVVIDATKRGRAGAALLDGP